MLLKLSKYSLYLPLLSVVVVATSTFFPFIGGKYYFFRVTVELALIFFILWWAFEAREGEVERLVRGVAARPLFLAVSLFVLVFLLASVFAYDANGAFWSSFERGEGGFQMLHYYIFFFLLMALFREWKEWKIAFWVSIVAALLMIAYGLFAYIQLTPWGHGIFCNTVTLDGTPRERCVGFITPYSSGDPAKIPGTLWGLLSKERFQGALGNPAYVAPYLMFILFYVGYLWIKGSWKKEWIKHSIFALLALVFLLFFVLSQTRGAFLGLVAAFGIFLIYFSIFSKKYRKYTIGFIVFCVVIGGLLLNHGYRKILPGSLARPVDGFLESPLGSPLNRFLDLGFSEATARTRFWTWNSAWQGFKDRPILGWGPENFSTVFDRHFDPRHFVPGQNSETWFDRAHSVIFDYLSETGLLGLLSYLSVFVIFYWQFFRSVSLRTIRGNHDRENHAHRHEIILMGLVFVMPVAYLVQGLFLFDVLPIYLNLFFFLAFADYLFSQHHNTGSRTLNSHIS